MKATLFCTAFTIMLFHHGYAQLSRGSFVAGATLYPVVRHWTDGADEVKSYKVTINPGISYFVKDKLAVGLVAPWTYSSHKHPDHSVSQETYAVGPAMRYYFPFGHWAVFPMISHTYGWLTQKAIDTSHSTSTNKGNLRTFTGGAGITYFITRHVGVEGMLCYEQSKLTWKDRADGSFTDWDITWNIGVQAYIFRK